MKSGMSWNRRQFNSWMWWFRLPDDIYIKSLEPCHAQLVYDHWPHKYASSFKVSVENIVDLPSAGVFLKDGDRLVAWAVCFPPIGISRFHTLDEFRCRGYGSYVIKYLSKRMAQAGFCPYGGIYGGNEPSVRCFTNVGYTMTSSAEPVNLISAQHHSDFEHDWPNPCCQHNVC